MRLGFSSILSNSSLVENKLVLMSMGGRAEVLACADPGARTPIGANGSFDVFLTRNLHLKIKTQRQLSTSEYLSAMLNCHWVGEQNSWLELVNLVFITWNVSNQRSHYFHKMCLSIIIGGYFSLAKTLLKYISNHTLISFFFSCSKITSWKKFATTTGVMFDSYTTPQI